MSLNLFELLTSLNGAEKRYCNLYLKTFANKTGSNKLLNDFAVVQHESKKVKGNKRNITEGNSTRLYYKLLDALFLFHQETILPDEKQMIRRARVLYSKGFYKEAFRITEKILRQNPNENHLLKIEVIEMRMLYAIKGSNVDYLKNKINDDKKKLEDLSKEYFNLIEFESLWAYYKWESTTSYFFGNKYPDQSVLLKSEENAFSPAAKVIYNKIKGYVSMKEGNYPEANFFASRAKHIYEQNNYLIKKDPGDYLRSSRNLCISLMFNKMFNEAHAFLDDMEKTTLEFSKHPNADVVNEYFILFVLIRLDIIISSGKIKEAGGIMTELESKYNKLKDVLPFNERLNANVSFSTINITLGNYRKAIRQINFLIKNAAKFRKDAFYLGLISELVVHFQLGNIELVESKLNSLKRYFNDPDLPFKFIIELPQLFRKILDSPDEKIHYTNLHNAVTAGLEKENKTVYRNFISLYCINYRK